MSGVVSAGLSTTVLPAASAGPIFQTGHHQRVVPRRDLADDADRLAADDRRVAGHVLAGRRALQHARGAGEEAQVVGDDGDLVGLDGLDRLAGVERLQLGELVAVRLDRVGDPQQRERALARRRARPALERAARGGDGAVDVGRVGERGACAICSPVAGLRTGSLRPSTGSTCSPSTKLRSVRVTVAAGVLAGRSFGSLT